MAFHTSAPFKRGWNFSEFETDLVMKVGGDHPLSDGDVGQTGPVVQSEFSWGGGGFPVVAWVISVNDKCRLVITNADWQIAVVARWHAAAIRAGGTAPKHLLCNWSRRGFDLSSNEASWRLLLSLFKVRVSSEMDSFLWGKIITEELQKLFITGWTPESGPGFELVFSPHRLFQH